MVIEDILAKNQMFPLRFYRVQMAASLTDSPLKIMETDATSSDIDITDYELPCGLSIAQVTWNLSAAGSAGSLTIKPFINGTVVSPADLLPVVATDQRGASKYLGPDTAARVAPPAALAVNYVGCKITTSAGWLADGVLDLMVTLWVIAERIVR